MFPYECWARAVELQAQVIDTLAAVDQGLLAARAPHGVHPQAEPPQYGVSRSGDHDWLCAYA